MELKLARQTLKADSELTPISFEQMAKAVDDSDRRGVIFYLDRENAEKDLKKLETFFKGKNRHTLIREVRYGLDSKDYVYEVHVL